HGNSTTIAIELLIAKIHKVPVRIAHSHSTYTKYPIINKILRPVFNFSYTDGFAVSEKSAKWLFNKENYYIVENGIDVGQLMYEEKLRIKIRKALNINDNQFI